MLKMAFLFQKVGYVWIYHDTLVSWRVPVAVPCQEVSHNSYYRSSFLGNNSGFGWIWYQSVSMWGQSNLKFRIMSPMSSLKPNCLVHGVVSSRLALRLKVPECGMHAQALQSAWVKIGSSCLSHGYNFLKTTMLSTPMQWNGVMCLKYEGGCFLYIWPLHHGSIPSQHLSTHRYLSSQDSTNS